LNIKRLKSHRFLPALARNHIQSFNLFDLSHKSFIAFPLSIIYLSVIFNMQLISALTLAMLNAGMILALPSTVVPRNTPAVCWDECNNAVLELNAVGSGVACTAGSAYLSDLAACQECASANGGDTGSFPSLINC
jgi:hypothetical protein